MAVRVLIVDDQPLVRDGLRAIIGAADGLDVVGEAEDGLAAVAAVTEHAPDVVLMDIRMPRLDGLGAARRILDDGAEAPRVVVLTTFDLDEYVFAALECGCSGFLLKDSPREEVVAAVRAAASGEGLIDPAVTRRVIEEFARRPPSPAGADGAEDPRLSELTDREREVLALVARGMSNAEIAETLFVAPGTVKTHVGRVLMKLGLRDRVQAVVLAYETGLVRPGAEG